MSTDEVGKGHAAELTPLTVSTSCVQHKTSQDDLSLKDDVLPPEEKNTAIPRSTELLTPATTRGNPFETDIEVMGTLSSERSAKSTRIKARESECQVWPGQDHWKQKAKMAKMKRRNYNCFSHLNKRNRIIAKLLILMLVVGIAVGVGIGVSKPLGVGIWHEPKP